MIKFFYEKLVKISILILKNFLNIYKIICLKYFLFNFVKFFLLCKINLEKIIKKMIKFDQKNLWNKWLFKEKTIKKVLKSKEKISKNIPWWTNTDYKKLLKDTKNIFKSFEKKYEKLLVLWIWGSALWTSSVLSALKKEKNVIVLDNLDPEFCSEIFENLNWEKTLINVVSKSWKTIETNTQLSAIEKILSEKKLEFKNHILITVWVQKNELRDFAKKNEIKTLDIPEEIWWRFSVFTWVSLFPLLFAWANIDDFLTWAIEWIEDFKNKNFEENIALQLASSQFEAYIFENKNIAIYKTYSKKLVWLLDWKRQLLAESLWKNRKIGITPLINFGSTDQHSQLQLHLEWPKDKHITLLTTWFLDWPITDKREDFLHKKSFWEVQKTFLEATKKSFLNYKIWYQEFFIEKINEKSIWKYMALNMISIWILWEVFEINAYDQPAVEFGKVEAIGILNRKI